MSNDKILQALKNYVGDNFYLKLLKNSADTLTNSQFIIAKKLLETEAINNNDKNFFTEPVKVLKINWSKYSQKEPFDFQKEGINWLIGKKHAILGDEQGLGKSIQAIIASKEAGYKKILVVCPATLKLNWKREIEVFDPDVSVIYANDYKCSKYTIINYDLLKKYYDKLIKEKFELIIADEAHLIKNSSAIRSKNLKKLSTKAKATWLLTGTPIANKPIDFFFLLKICKHELGSNKEAFGKRYCGAVNNGFGWVYNGASNLKELHYKTQNVILRRVKEQVLSLPEKIQIPIYLELSPKERKEYNNCVELYYDEIEKLINDPTSEMYGMTFNPSNSYLAELSIYRQYTALKKILDRATPELIENSLEEGKKVIVFTNYRKVIDNLAPLFKNDCVVLDGRKTLEERQVAIDAFQTSQHNSPRIIICNYQVASVGVTLTQAQTMIMNDLPWSPAQLQQAQDRAHRIGQKNTLNIYYPIYEETIDAVMFNVLKTKLQHISEILTGNPDISNMFVNESIAEEIYNQLKKK